ncbi:MAG: class I SAM-dependent methyltransferase [Candidatus Thorarchaeota archaeon]
MNDISNLKENWEKLAESDPWWAILVEPRRAGRKWDITEFFETGKREIKNAIAILDEVGIETKRKRALDFGCGIGRLTQALSNYFAECIGVDISPKMVNLARHYDTSDGRCTFLVNQQPNLRIFPSDHFDLIYTSRVLQHIKTPLSRKYILEFTRILKPSGVVVFQVPSDVLGWKNSLRRAITNSRILRPFVLIYAKRRYGTPAVMEMHTIPRKEVRKLLEEGGCNIVEVKKVNMAGDSYSDYLYVAVKSSI